LAESFGGRQGNARADAGVEEARSYDIRLPTRDYAVWLLGDDVYLPAFCVLRSAVGRVPFTRAAGHQRDDISKEELP
jgi:hypothetical protein